MRISSTDDSNFYLNRRILNVLILVCTKKTHIIESVSSDKKECPWYLVTSVMVKRILKHLSEKVIANSLVEPSQKRAIWYLTLELILHGNNSKAGNRFINPIFSN